MECIPNQEIYDEIMLFILNRGSDFNEWFVGITDDPENQLFTFHKVNKFEDPWIYKKAKSLKDANLVRKIFRLTKKTDGGSDSNNNDAVFVYAYKKSTLTIP
jgi:hypothetical protein